MKFLFVFLTTILLAACSMTPGVVAQTTNDTTPIPTDIVLIQPTTDTAAEEATIRALIESFGKSLQNVSLLAVDAAQEVQSQYAPFVSPALLQTWVSDVSNAPGRMVSSPWPDRIEITALAKNGTDRFVIAGFLVEVSSTEVVNGGAAARVPVQIVVQKDQGHWLITEYREG
jgi:hypothetical protein